MKMWMQAAGVFAALVTALPGQTVWTNTGGGNWNVAGNWNPNDVPDTGSETAWVQVAGDYTINLTSAMYAALTNAVLAVTNCNARLEVEGVNYCLAGGAVANSFVLQGGSGGTSTVSWLNGGIDTGNGLEANRGDIVVDQGARLYTTNTTILCQNLTVKNGATMTFGGSANPALTVRNGSTGYIYLHYGGTLYCRPGTVIIRNGRVRMENNSTTLGRSTLILDGATMSGVIIQMANIAAGGPGSLFEIRSGNVSIGSVIIGRLVTTGVLDEMRVTGGNTTCSGDIQIGNSSTSGKAHGIYGQTGGTLSCVNFLIGSHSNDKGGGYFSLSGGTATVGLVQFYTDDSPTTADNFGTRQFVVGSNAVLRLTGAGFAVTGTNNWLIDFSSGTNLFDTSGTLVFDPTGVTTQRLLAFAPDAGENWRLLTTNTAIGTLDLTGYNGAEKLLVVAASNAALNAVYVDNLVGLTPAEAATHLETALKIYYNGRKSADMNKQRVSLSGGGELIPLFQPSPGTLIEIR